VASHTDNSLTIYSLRAVNKWVSSDTVHTWEDALLREAPDSVRVVPIGRRATVVRRLFRNRLLRNRRLTDALYRRFQNVFGTGVNGITLMTCVGSADTDFVGFVRGKQLSIAYVVDAWEDQVDEVLCLLSCSTRGSQGRQLPGARLTALGPVESVAAPALRRA